MDQKTTQSWETSDDIISHLPDDILCHILSFMPITDSVATCVLSKRWEHVWEYLTKLSFDYYQTPSLRFGNIVSKALSSQTNLSEFYLRCYFSELYDVTKWVSNSIARNIQSLELKLHDENYQGGFELPRCVFTCKTLESLRLEGHILVIVPTLVCLPKLRTLELVQIEYQDDGGRGPYTLISSCSSSLESLLVDDTRGRRSYVALICSTPQILCSALRHLNLETTSINSVEVPRDVFTCQTLEKLRLCGYFFICDVPTISMPNLTSLALILGGYQDDEILNRLFSSCTSLESLNLECSIEAELNISSCTLKLIELKLLCDSNHGHKLVIDAPCLNYLKLHSRGRVDYHIADLASLEEADVSIFFDNRDYCICTLKSIYKALHHVKSLKVNHAFDKRCPFAVALQMFNRLTDLDIYMHSWRSYVLREFINKSFKLENLILDGLCGYTWTDWNIVPACLLTSLRSVSITNFSGKGGEILMAKYFLRNAKILEKMQVCFAFHIQSLGAFKEKISKEISNACRGSEKCVVLFK